MKKKKIINGVEIPEQLLKLSRNELLVEVARLRNLIEWLDPSVRYYLERVGAQMLVVRRDYKVFDGILLQTQWELKSIEIGVVDRRYDYNTEKYVIEKKVMIIPLSAITDIEFLQDRAVDVKATELLGQPESSDVPEERK